MKAINPLDFPVCLDNPARLAASYWTGHIPFAMSLIAWLRPRCFVELGTFSGASYCAFCQAIARVGLETKAYAVDTWKGDPHNGFNGPEVLEELRAHHDPRYASFSRLIPSTFDEALAHFEDGSIDLLHIDGYHVYEAVKHDFESWLPKMSDCGVILFHDINVRERDFGVWKLWDDIKQKYPSFEFAHSHGLGVLQVGKVCADVLRVLLESSAEEAAKIRAFYSQLGQRLCFHWEKEQIVVACSAEQEKDRKVSQEQLAELQAKHQHELEACRKSDTEQRAAHQKQLADLQAANEKQLEAWLKAQAEQRAAHQKQLDIVERDKDKELQEQREAQAVLEIRLAEAEQLLQVHRFQLAEKGALVHFQNSQILAKDGLLQSQGAQLAERAALVRAHSDLQLSLQRQIEAGGHREQCLQADIDAIRHSLSFRLAFALSRLARRLAPAGTLRGKFVHLGRRGASVLRREGIKSFCRKAIRKIARTTVAQPMPPQAA
jgi:hypothetical protein